MNSKSRKAFHFLIVLAVIVTALVMLPISTSAKTQIIATADRYNAPKIGLDKSYILAANNAQNKDMADVLAWNSGWWNNYHYVKFILSEKNTITIEIEDLEGSNCWFKFYDSNGNAVSSEMHVGVRHNTKQTSNSLTLEAGTYYLGLQPHATNKFIIKTETKISVSESKLEMNAGDFTYLDVIVNKNGQEILDPKVSFRSTDINVAKVSTKGKVVAVGIGACKIRVSYNGHIKYVSVVVYPNKVTNVKKVSATKTSIKLAWKKQKGVSGYEVWMYDRDLEEYTKVKTTTNSLNTVAITGLKKFSTYKFKVRAYVKNGSKKAYGDYSKEIIAKTT